MNSVTTGGPGLVAVGEDGSVENWDGAVWLSVDGTTWSRVGDDEGELGGPDDEFMNSVTWGGPGLVAVGRDNHGNAVSWTSVDGSSWSRVPHDEAVFGGPGRTEMRGVTVGSAGLVAVGWERDLPPDGSCQAAVWTSVDGVAWTRVPRDEAVFGGVCPGMFDVVAGGPGLVAVGSDGYFGNSEAAVWTSVDGITWSRIPNEGGVFGGEIGTAYPIRSVAVGPTGLVAVGEGGADGHESGVVWFSDDGITWSRAPHDEEVLGGPGSQWMRGVTAGGPGFVAVGADRPLSIDLAIWTASGG